MVPVSLLLTRSEERVLQLVAEGMSDREIAARLGCSPKTVGNHLSRAYLKLRVGRRMDAVMAAGLIAQVRDNA